VRFRWPVVLIWMLRAVGLTMVTNVAGPTTNNEVMLPGTDSQAAFGLLAAESPPQQNGSSPAAYHVPSGRVDDNGPDQAAITKASEPLLTDRDVAAITNPFADPAAGLDMPAAVGGPFGSVAPVPDVGLSLARVIGLGVGIDYALFVVSKHRTFMLEHRYEPRVAGVRSVATGGGAQFVVRRAVCRGDVAAAQGGQNEGGAQGPSGAGR